MHNIAPTPDLVTTAQAADLLGVDVATVNRWATDGRLPVVLKGPGLRGARWFARHEVEALATERAQS